MMLRLYDHRRVEKVWVEPADDELRIHRMTPADYWQGLRVAVVADTIRRVAAYTSLNATVMDDTDREEVPALNVPAAVPHTPPVDVVVGTTDDIANAPLDVIATAVATVQSDTLDTLEAFSAHDAEPAAFRCLCLLTPYRQPLILDASSLATAQKLFARLRWNVRQWRRTADESDSFVSVQGRRFAQDFRAAVTDDLALNVGLSIAQQVIDHDMQPDEKLRLLSAYDTVFGLGFTV